MSKGDKIFLGTCITILIVLVAVSIVCMVNPRIVPWYPYGKETSTYSNLTVEKVKELIETNASITILDVRALEGCGSCQFNNGHLPGAILTSDAKKYYNATYDILVYSKDGTVGEEFCKELKYHVYGNIYNLQGGWEEWLSSLNHTNESYEHNINVGLKNNETNWSPPWEFEYEEESK